MHYLIEETGSDLSPSDIDMLQRVFERTCILAQLSKRSAGGDRIARFLVDEFRLGHTDEACLLECALWFTKRRSPKSENLEHGPAWIARTRHGRLDGG